MKIQVSLSAPGLHINRDMYKQALDSKHAGTVIMSPEDFLRLTTRGARDIQVIMDEAKTLEEYNAYTKSGKSIYLPWLYVTLDGMQYKDTSPSLKVGAVVGHEGRHRAAALIKAGQRKMAVSLRLYVGGIERRYRYGEGVEPFSKESWTREDLPKYVYGEFSSERVALNVASFKPY